MDTNNENKIEDSEAGLEADMQSADLHQQTKEDLVESEKQEQFVDEETALRVEFQQAVEKMAEQRATTPFQVAAMTHARMCNPAIAEIDRVSGGAAKRILKYLIAYPFYVKELNPQDKQVEALAQVCDRLVHTKFTMAMCQAIEKEQRIAAAIKEQEDLIQPLPDDIINKNNEENKE